MDSKKKEVKSKTLAARRYYNRTGRDMGYGL